VKSEVRVERSSLPGKVYFLSLTSVIEFLLQFSLPVICCVHFGLAVIKQEDTNANVFWMPFFSFSKCV